MLQKCLSALHSDLRGPRFGSVWPRFEGPDRSNPRFKLNEQSSVRISVRIGCMILVIFSIGWFGLMDQCSDEALSFGSVRLIFTLNR